MNQDILIVDDENDIRSLIQGILEDEGYTTRAAAHSTQAYDRIKAKRPALVVLDIWLQGSEHDGLTILKNIKEEHPNIPVIMISGHGTIETAVSAIKEGAYDFIEKPFKSDRLLVMIKRALETAALRKENAALKQKTTKQDISIIGHSNTIKQFEQILHRVAKTNSRVLLTGEAGSGKEIAARIIHKESDRADHPFMILNCATMRPERLEIELFGSTADIEGEAKVGLLEQAHGGTLLLDEVSDMPLETQGKIVRVLQDQKFQKPGSDSFTHTDVRILASTNKNLEEEVKEKRFREDLFYRLNVVPIHIPSLRERTQDIPDLVDYFMRSLNKESGLPIQKFSPQALELMKTYSWPGNVRQLRNTVEWAMIMNTAHAGQNITPAGLPPEFKQNNGLTSINNQNEPSLLFLDLPLKEARDLFERGYLDAQVKRFEGNISRTAEFIGMERSALHRKIKSLKRLSSDKVAQLSESQNDNINEKRA